MKWFRDEKRYTTLSDLIGYLVLRMNILNKIGRKCSKVLLARKISLKDKCAER